MLDDSESGALQTFMRGRGGTIVTGVVVALSVAIFVGLVALFWDYAPRLDESRYRRERRRERVQNDTGRRMKGRFWVGAAIGAVLGAGAYVAVSRRPGKKQ